MKSPDKDDWKALGLALLGIAMVAVLGVALFSTEDPGDSAAERAGPEAIDPGQRATRWYVHDSVNVRAGPGLEHEVVRQLQPGDQVYTSYWERSGWKAVYPGREPSDTVGWIKNLHLREGPPAPPPDLELLSHGSETDQHSRYVTGRVRNNSGQTYNYVQVEVNLYDGAGTLVGSTLDNVNNLEPGQVWEFRALITDERTEQYKIAGVSGY